MIFLHINILLSYLMEKSKNDLFTILTTNNFISKLLFTLKQLLFYISKIVYRYIKKINIILKLLKFYFFLKFKIQLIYKSIIGSYYFYVSFTSQLNVFHRYFQHIDSSFVSNFSNKSYNYFL